MDPWEDDRLGYKAIGDTFTNLIKSIDSAKVISIEAGFGRGKTFFREAWAEHLRQSGEVVIEIDVQQSDHSGEPVVTLLGALVDVMPKGDDDKGKKAMAAAKKFGAIGVRTVAKTLLRAGADELIDAFTDTALDNLDFDAFDKVINELGDGMSKAAGQLIAAQMAAEKVREKELPEQLDALFAALQNDKSKRVIIIIDELDRCHPDYAIAFLEAMKQVFNRSGFVFCLMINADYLENLAQHRFGVSTNDEKYLDKFVDIRLILGAKEDNFKNAVYELALELPLKTPYGDSGRFSVEHAAKLASNLAVHTKLSMRMVKRILLKVEIALRCYADRPLDASLLVFLAFKDVTTVEFGSDFLPRSFLTPKEGVRKIEWWERSRPKDRNNSLIVNELNQLKRDSVPELFELPYERYQMPGDEYDNHEAYYEWHKVFKYLAPHYVPSHQEVLNAVAVVIAPAD